MSNRVLVAFDESPQATAALEHAFERFPDAEITVVHVTDPSEWLYGDDFGGGYFADDAYETAKESADSLLAEVETMAEEAGREVSTISEAGSVPNTIVRVGETIDADHIVIGSHGRRGLSRFLLGSVAEMVARRAPVSVTIIRQPAPAAEE